MLVEKGSVCKVLCGFKNTVFRKHFIRPNHCNYTRYHWNQKFLWSIENKILPVINEVRVKFKWFPYFPTKHIVNRSFINKRGAYRIALAANISGGQRSGWLYQYEGELTWSEEPEGHILSLDWLIYMWLCGIKSDISWNRNIHPQLALNIYRYGQKIPRMKADNLCKYTENKTFEWGDSIASFVLCYCKI